MSHRKREPRSRLALPELWGMVAVVEPEYVWDSRLRELPVEPDVLGLEARVALSHVEREQGRIAVDGRSDVRDERMRTRPRVGLRRSKAERLRARRVGRMEVTAPRLDGGKGLEMVQREQEGAVAAR